MGRSRIAERLRCRWRLRLVSIQCPEAITPTTGVWRGSVAKVLRYLYGQSVAMSESETTEVVCPRMVGRDDLPAVIIGDNYDMSESIVGVIGTLRGTEGLGATFGVS